MSGALSHGHGASAASLERLSQRCPLVTMIRPEALVRDKGMLTTRSSLKVREIEEACGLTPGRYFYAGRACPDYGHNGPVSIMQR